MIKRRTFLLGSMAAGTFGLWAASNGARTPAAASAFDIVRTEAEWKALLTPAEFQVLREEATERPFTSALLKEARAGTYTCAGCDLPLYASQHKYDSRTGWPSFYQAINPTAVGTKVDYKLLYPRTEAHCSRCGGHLGHIFDDGPEPTGKRHCINGVAMDFVASA